MNGKFLVLILFSFTICSAQTKYITTSDSVALHVSVKGKGTPCLYLHGGPGSGSHWLEEFMGSFLEQNFTMVYLDQRGVGRSTSPKEGNYSLDRMVLDFEEVRQALGIESWLTLGHSVGGVLQMAYVKENPEVIKGMIFINGTLSLKDSFGNSWLPKAVELAGEDAPTKSLDTSTPIYQRMLGIMPVLQEKGLFWKIFFDFEESSRTLNQTYADFADWNSDLSEKVLELEDYWEDFRPLSSSIKQPVLFFYGNRDWAIGPRHYENLAFPNLTLFESEGGHMPFLENKPDLMKAIERFQNKNGF